MWGGGGGGGTRPREPVATPLKLSYEAVIVTGRAFMLRFDGGISVL